MGRIYRKSAQSGLRIFVDQVKRLRELRRIKFKDGVSTSHLIREAVDRYLDEEFERLEKQKQHKPE